MAENFGTMCYTLRSQPFVQGREREALLYDLLTPGDIATPALAGQLRRLAGQFAAYLAYYPFGAWRQGLVVSKEMHRWTEQYLPLAELWRGWRNISAAGLRFPAPELADEFLGLTSWLAFLERCHMPLPVAPHLVLGQMLYDEAFRRQLLFAWHLPPHHGGGFDRYPAQLAWLRSWLTTLRQRGEKVITCLDAACGSGEGTYELAAAALEAGYAPGEIIVWGSTLQPLAVAAAGLACFPHDLPREAAYRRRVRELVPLALLQRMVFRQEDLLQESDAANVSSVILCNGLLGGPLLHELRMVQRVLAGLVRRLKPGGILLADDRFHAGWRRVMPLAALRELFVAAGLQLVAVPSGIGGIRSATGQ